MGDPEEALCWLCGRVVFVDPDDYEEGEDVTCLWCWEDDPDKPQPGDWDY